MAMHEVVNTESRRLRTPEEIAMRVAEFMPRITSASSFSSQKKKKTGILFLM
jgi:hypothetical protein